jgi:hypothetical protein
MKRLARSSFAVLLCAIGLSVPSGAQEAGLAVILDVQNTDGVTSRFCVYESKVYSLNSEICISKTRKLTCQAVDPNAPTPVLAWAAADDKVNCAAK